jgi:hypothetical protein
MDGQHEQFEKGVAKVHKKSVYQILIYWLRVCPVLTGRLRGSLTPYLDRNGKQNLYTKYLKDRSLVTGGRKTDTKQDRKLMEKDETEAGKLEGFVSEGMEGLLTTVGTNVVYAAAVDRTTQHFTKTLARGQQIYNKNFQNYLAAAAEAGWIPKAESVPEDPDEDDGDGG